MKKLAQNPIITALLGFVFGAVIGPVVVNYVDSSFFEKTRVQYEVRVEIAKALIADLEKIKMTAPSNSVFKECLATKGGEVFEDNYEECYGELRQKQEEARSILNRNVASIEIFFDPLVSKEVLGIIDEMDYLLYEMEDNQYILESWSERECPDMVSIIPFNKTDAGDNVKTVGPKGQSCTLGLQTRQAFMESLEKGEVCADCISTLRKRVVPSESVDTIIIPGGTISLKEYLLSMNSNLYSNFLANADSLMELLRVQIL